MTRVDDIIENSFPVDTRQRLPFLKAVFNWAVRRPLVPITSAAIALGGTPQQIFMSIFAGVAAYSAVAIPAMVKSGMNISQIRGQWCDRAVNRLLAKKDANGEPVYSEEHPKVFTLKASALAHRVSYMNSKGSKSVLGVALP